MMKMTCKEISDVFWKEYKKINIKKYRKVHFKIYLCETDGKRDFKTAYKFSYLAHHNKNEIHLENYSRKTKKILNKNNVVWINSIVLYDKNLEFVLCDYDYAEIKEVENG